MSEGSQQCRGFNGEGYILTTDKVRTRAEPILPPSFDSNQKRLDYILNAILNGNIPIEIGVQALGFMERCKKDIKSQKIDDAFFMDDEQKEKASAFFRQ